MARQTPSDQRELDQLRHLCQQDLHLAELAPCLGQRLARHVGADGHCFLVLDPAAALPTGVFGESSRLPGASDVFFQSTFGRSPLTDWRQRVTDSRRVRRAEDLVGDDPGQDPYLRHLVRDYGWEGEVHVSMVEEDRGWGYLALHRREGRERFDDGAFRYLEAAAPVVTSGLRRASARAILEAAPAAAEAVLTLDPDGRVEAVSSSGAGMAFGMTPGERGVPLGVTVMTAQVRKALRQGTPMADQALVFVDPDRGERYEIRGQVLSGLDGRPRGAVLIQPLRALDDPRILARLGLTRREIDVVLASIRGFTTSGAARFLGLSPHTVEHHLKNVFSKLGVASRSELAAVVLGA